MAAPRSRWRTRLVLTALLVAAVAAVATLRRRRLEAATADFHRRHGPL